MQGQGGGWRSANTEDVGATLEPTRLRSNERGEDGASYNPRRSRHSARARPTAAPRTSPPRSEAEGSAAAADAKRQREQPTGGYGTPKGAAGSARHVPGSASEASAPEQMP